MEDGALNTNKVVRSMEDPEIYSKLNINVRNDVEELVKEYKSCLEWGVRERILDVGSGPGDVTSEVLLPILPEDAVVVGCDISKRMINYSEEFHGSSRLAFQVLDIEQKYIDLTWPPESFDKVFSFYCLHWIHDHRRALKNIHSLLKKNGYIFLMFLTPKNPAFLLLEKLKSMPKWEIFTKGIHWFFEWEHPSSHYEGLLRETGFENIECCLRKTFHYYPSIEHFFQLLQTVDPYVHTIPDEMKTEYHQDMLEMLIKEKVLEYNENSRLYVVEYNHIVALARKFG